MGSGPSRLAQCSVEVTRAIEEKAVPRQIEDGAQRIQHQHQRGEACQLPAIVRGEYPVVQQEHVRRPG